MGVSEMGTVPDPSERPESGASGDSFHPNPLVPKANWPCASGSLCALVFCLESQHCGNGASLRAGGWVTLGLSFTSLGQAYPLRPGLGPAHSKGISGLDKLGSLPHGAVQAAWRK